MIRDLGRAAAMLFVMTALPAAAVAQTAPRDGQRDFDFEFGTWRTQVRILARPLSGANEWVEMSGTTVVRPLLEGRANVAELKVKNEARSIDGVSLRLYHPQTGEWYMHYANSSNGVLDKPLIGGFKEGRGEFYAQDSYGGRAILVRFVISPLARDSWQFEQAFSPDGGRTWEVNWVATDTRVK